MLFSRSLLHTLLLITCSCCCVYTSSAGELPALKDTISFCLLGELKNRNLIIRDTIDLYNKKCIIPSGVTLVFKGGLIKNGTLEGNMTRIKSTSVCFDRVSIMGTWNVKSIKTTLFNDLSYDNALKDVLALTNPNIKNLVVINEGDYKVSAYKEDDVCIPVCSNTELVINGSIRLSPNGFRYYSIIQASGNNIKIKGNGTIFGDRHSHTGNTGEWGMGVYFSNAHHVKLRDLSIRDCWGDCIYVGDKSSYVLIEECRLDNSRRQGISVTSAEDVIIRNCIITNVGGTPPGYAIDIEPNPNDIVDNIRVNSVKVNNCKGGFLVFGKALNARIGLVEFTKCSILNAIISVRIEKCETAKVQKCVINNRRKDTFICKEVDKALIRNNIFE